MRIWRVETNVRSYPGEATCEPCAFVVNHLTKKAHTVFLTTEFDISPEYRRLAGLDKTHQPYNNRWSCPIPPQENRLAVQIQAGEKKFKDDDH